MNDQEFREHILTFIVKSEQWMQDANKKLDVIKDLQQQLSSIRGKLEDTRESEDEKQDTVDRDEETQETDPLLALAGTLQCDLIDIEDRIKDALNALQAEIRVVEGAHKDHPDPLIALAGTLQCDVTDIGERHDDYIAAALLVELRGDKNE